MPVPFVFAVVLRQLLDKAFGDIQRVTRQSRLQLVATRVTWVRGKTPADPDAIKGLHIADTCFYYPEDRWISENALIARELAQRIEVS